MNGTVTIAAAGPYSYTSPHDRNTNRIRPLFHRLAGSGRPAPGLLELGVAEDRIYTDHGLTGTNRAPPALAAVRAGDTLVVPKLDRLARSVPDARAVADLLRERGVKMALGRTLYDPDDPMGKMFFNILATFAEFEADLIRSAPARAWPSPAPKENCAASSPNCPTVSSGNSAACTPPASIPSAISPSSSPSQDQPSIAHSTDAIPLSVRSCPPPELTRVSALTAHLMIDGPTGYLCCMYS